MVDLPLLLECFAHTAGRVRYRMGAKPPLGADSSTFAVSDCSGWVRWALDRAGLTLPDGSTAQHGFAETHFRPVPYADATEGPGLYIAFIAPRGAEPGHVWLLRGAKTMECHGGAGVSSRPWNSPSLRRVCACYEVPTK